MKLCDIINVIEKIAPPALAAQWDKSGLQVAAFRHEARHLAVMLDPVPSNIAQALELGADFILAHHPLSIEPRHPDAPGSYHSALSLLFRADVPLYSAHTSLDANPLGPVRWLAEKFNLADVEVLDVQGKLPGQGDYGFGFVGNLSAALPYAVFCQKLSAFSAKQSWRSCGPRPDQPRRVACCPGSGGSMIALAKAAGADVFITGDLRYHAALEAEINVIDIGHFQLEEIMMREFAAILDAQLAETRISFIESSDPLLFDMQ